MRYTERAFSTVQGEGGEKIVRAVTEQKGPDVKVITGFAQMKHSFKEALSVLPWVGAFFGAKSTAEAAANAVEESVKESAAYERNEAMRDLIDKIP